ncbi:MAG: hypothetical protein ACXWHB_01305, partial [Usitatibacter sp.]
MNGTLLDHAVEGAFERHREGARVVDGSGHPRVADGRGERGARDLPSRLVALALQRDVAKDHVVRARAFARRDPRGGVGERALRRVDLPDAKRADAPVLENDGIGRLEGHGQARRRLRRSRANFHAARREAMNDEPPRGKRRRVDLDVVDAHVEIGPVDLDRLHLEDAAEPALDALDLHALAEEAGDAGEHELRASRRRDDPPS